MKDKPLIHIVIPLYNEAGVIAGSVTTLIHFLLENNFPYRYKIILANNASTDNSLEICKELATKNSNVEVFDIGEKGKGLAVRKVWERSAEENDVDVLAFMDADLSSDLSYFKPLVDAVVIGESDMAIGNRLGKTSKVYSRKIIRKIMSRCYNILVRIVFNTGISDHQCGFKAMKKESFRAISGDLKENNFFMDTELIVLAKRRGMKISEVDIVWREGVDSKVAILGSSLEFLKSIFNFKKRLK